MPVPGSPEWHERVARMFNEESQQANRWFYLSFSDGSFLGGAFVEARGPATALKRSHELRINPGGEVRTIEVDRIELLPPAEMRDRLLTKAELEAWTKLERWK